MFGWGVSDLPHKLTAFKVQEVAEKKIGKWLVIYQIWYFKSISNKMPGKRTIILSAFVCLSSSLDTHRTNKLKEKLQMDSATAGMRKRSFSLRFQPPLSRDAVTVVSHSYCYEFSIVISRIHSCHKAG